MRKRCDVYWTRFVSAQVNAKAARSEDERLVWLQVAEIWLTLAQAEQMMGATPMSQSLSRSELSRTLN
jgi:hypothetical protein